MFTKMLATYCRIVRILRGQSGRAKAVGYKERERNIACGTADLELSVYALGRYVLKPDAWRLFRRVKADYVRS